MDRNQMTNDTETAIRYGLDGRQAVTWSALPAIVTKVNFPQMTLECTPAIQGVISNPDGSTTNVTMPKLVDVPIIFPGAGGFILTMPIAVGDEVLVVFASRCIDAWWQSGGIQPQAELRMHDLSDGFAFPGPKSLPNVVPNISSTSTQLRSKDGTFVFGLDKATGLFQMENATQSLSGVLTSLNNALITFATGLTPVNLAAQAAALVASLTLVATCITELLE